MSLSLSGLRALAARLGVRPRGFDPSVDVPAMDPPAAGRPTGRRFPQIPNPEESSLSLQKQVRGRSRRPGLLRVLLESYRIPRPADAGKRVPHKGGQANRDSPLT